MEKPKVEQINRLLKCAGRGKAQGSSTGEFTARQLVGQAEKLSNQMMDMDGALQEAFLDLLRGLAWPDTRDAMLQAVEHALK